MYCKPGDDDDKMMIKRIQLFRSDYTQGDANKFSIDGPSQNWFELLFPSPVFISPFWKKKLFIPHWKHLNQII